MKYDINMPNTTLDNVLQYSNKYFQNKFGYKDGNIQNTSIRYLLDYTQISNNRITIPITDVEILNGGDKKSILESIYGIVFELYQLQVNSVLINAIFPDVCEDIILDFINDLNEHFYPQIKQEIFVDEPKQAQLAGNDKQRGRYRLTVDEIKMRQDIVRKAYELKKQDETIFWKDIDKQIAHELGDRYSDRTIRAWRHEPTYQ